MHLHRLEVEGFGPFRARQSVDFDAFADDGIFLIAGRTGAGKSSILDAICFGLYGGVPRYDGGEKRLRSDHCEPEDQTAVVVEFSTVAGHFRVTRSPAYDRPAKRGGGMTTQAPSALLEELTDDGWVGRAARVVDVANALDEILQLSQEQFLQVILLAQNRFADFLLADSKERQALLRRLFGTGRFSDYQARFEERRRTAEQALSGRRAAVDARLDEAERVVAEADLGGEHAVDAPLTSTDERLAQLHHAIARADYQVERLGTERATAEKMLSAADSALVERKEQRQAQDDRDRARIALAALEAQASEIAEAARQRDRARAAEGLRGILAAAVKAASALASADAARQDAVHTAAERGVPLSDSSGDADGASTGHDAADAEHLRKWASLRTQEVGAWQRAAELEAQTADRTADLAEATAAVATASAALNEVDAERASLPEQLATLAAERDVARRSGDRADDLARQSEQAAQRHAGAVDAARLASELSAARVVEADASAAHANAQAQLAELRKRRLDGYAGELAAALTVGAPCAVCGAVEHPSPAAHADPVSADDVSAAESVRDAAARAERDATQHLGTLTADHAVAAERAGGRTVEQAATEEDAARAAHAAAISDAKVADALADEVSKIEQRIGDLDARHSAASEALGAARTALSLVEQRTSEAERLITDARGAHASVADRVSETQALIAVASVAADAIDEHATRTVAAAEAAAERDDAIVLSVFDSAAEAESAMLPAAEIDGLDQRVTEHSAERKKERALLLDLEMRALPDERIDLAPAHEAAAQARVSWLAAVDADSRARGIQTSLSAIVAAAGAEHASSAADAEEFEVLRGLADALAGRAGNTRKMNLETFVLAAELEEIVASANLRLHDMSDGRYQLRHSDALAARGAASGLGIVVFDAFTGHTRPAKSLSGGETFLSSLALALGLAEVVTARAGGIRLDTLFIDEGFGSLDADTLDTAMRTLDELRQGGRTVGVISHVEAMQEQIPAQLTVRALPDGPSMIDAPRSAG
ncbi:Exonuclease SbcC [Microbacterium esteraromaticum]|uniref:Nuclease SbcCD subunit C n=1 Tax=Microbacterium esteraromaticum TaxID=57043 RepID=A0A1R4KE38_9MICO|nr:AAA family ATPase [Microbacterium esteraromaticum]SJN42566.1 Exonuclease SbcC [Microbacterium esteraromaticum]